MLRRLFRLHLALSPLTLLSLSSSYLTLLFFSHSPSAETEILLLPNPQATSAGSRPNFAAIQSILEQRRRTTFCLKFPNSLLLELLLIFILELSGKRCRFPFFFPGQWSLSIRVRLWLKPISLMACRALPLWVCRKLRYARVRSACARQSSTVV